MTTSPQVASAALQPIPAGPPSRSALPSRLPDALAALLQGMAARPGEDVPPAFAPGLVLAAPLQAGAPIPSHTRALLSGYGIAAADSFGASPYGPLRLREPPPAVSTGDALPPGCDALAEHHLLEQVADEVWISEPIAPGSGVRRVGEDAAAGTILREAGQRVRPIDVAAAALAGITALSVRRPVCVVLSEPAGEAAVVFLAAQMERAGCRVLSGDASSLAQLVPAGAADWPALRSPGGPVNAASEAPRSPARPDLVVAIGEPGRLRAHLGSGAAILAEALALRPGGEAILARSGAVPVVIAPPAVEDVLALWLTILAPVVARLSGAPTPSPCPPLRLARKIVSQVGLSEIVLLRTGEEALEPLATGSLPLSAMARADRWLVLADGQEGYPAGHAPTAFPLWAET